ncbi:uncharacterized protein K02A2.6-like [Anastrepha obliqua]|uniref:uncharacterized protein K02A2.6-like n=1 Tax=Anastrepha obliqua TaxID=95512 RepID=UPI002409FC5C|nr:uncharacterized protein K02A2.6-like [Anastrepha obliqua]
MSQRKYVNVKINNVEVKLQFDTASDITIISKANFKKLGLANTKEVTHSARSATGELPLYTQFVIKVELNGITKLLKCFVTTITLNVFGLDWISAFQLEDMPLSTICNHISSKKQASIVSIQKTYDKSLLKDFYPALFDKQLGLCNKTKAHLVVKANCEPVFRPKRVVACAIQHLVEAELQRLQDLNVISPVNYSNWAAPIVVIKKPNGRIRLCADFSTFLNDALETYQYPLPLPEDIFAKLNNATDQMLAGLNNTAAYIDDIFVSGKNQADHDANLREVLLRIQQYGFKLKVDKCKFFYHEMAYLGYVLNKDGISLDPKHIDAIKYMPEPTNQSELR